MIVKTIAALIAATTFVCFTADAQARKSHHDRHHAQNVLDANGNKGRRHATIELSAGCQSDNNGHTICGGGRSVMQARRSDGSASSFAARAVESATNEVEDLGGRSGTCLSRPKTSHLWCGCGSADYVGLSNTDGYWDLAQHWKELPHVAPAPRMAAVRNSHVMILEASVGGADWVVFDPNSGHGRAHRHVRSIAGYVIVDPHGTPRWGSYAAHSRRHEARRVLPRSG